MTNSRVRDLIQIGDRLFGKRSSLMSLWQDIAENFYPERADFTLKRVIGDDFASHLMTGFPALQLRDLADQLASMLRPRQILWAKLQASDERRNEDTAARQWLEYASEVQRRAMYARRAQFLRATKTGDADFVSFGQTVILPSMNHTLDGLLFRTFHLRDTAWTEDRDGVIDSVHRCEKMCARDMLRYFPKTAPDEIRNIVDKEPHKEFEVRHIVVPADQYDGKANPKKFGFYSLFVDKEHEKILEEVPQRRLGYIIPRWKLGAFSQYATSPCTMLGLPDARLMQQMTLSLLEAGEKAATPPLVATLDAVRSDAQVFAGGITWVDREYDERLGEALRPIAQDFRGLSGAENMLEQVRALMKDIFFLNKLNLPEVGHDMTAFETRKRVEEYVRAALPLFEPMEVEYNAALCDEVFAILMENNAFGPPQMLPDALRGADVRFEFVSPLQQTAERAKVVAFQEAAQLTGIAMQADPTSIENLDVQKGYRDALMGADVPADWLRDLKDVQQRVAQKLKQQQQEAQLAALQQAAVTAGKVAPAIQALTGA